MKKKLTFAPQNYMVVIAQLVRASDCGSEGRGFEPRFSPFEKPFGFRKVFLCAGKLHNHC